MTNGADIAHPVRILMVSPLPPPPGGMETWTQILCDRGLPPPFAFELVDTKAFRERPQARARLNLGEARRNLRILARIRRALASGRFSLMHLNCALTPTGAPRNLASALLARRAGAPYVAHLHGTFSIPRGGGAAARFYRRAYRAIFSGAAAILALGKPSYEAVLELGDFAGKTRSLMPNFVDFRRIPGGAARPERRGRVKVCYSGALIAEKGVHTIVEVAERLPGVEFLLMGDGPAASRARLEDGVRARGLEDSVRVRGPVDNRDVVRALAECDAFLFPSAMKYEGFPYSVAEAMAVGLPVAASSAGALPEMIDAPEGGFLAAPGDAAAYACVLARWRDDGALRRRMGRHNRAKALREYDYDVVVPQLCELYARVARAA